MLVLGLYAQSIQLDTSCFALQKPYSPWPCLHSFVLAKTVLLDNGSAITVLELTSTASCCAEGGKGGVHDRTAAEMLTPPRASHLPTEGSAQSHVQPLARMLL